MSVLGVFDQRFRGFRVVEIGGVGVLLVLVLVVYLAKTGAGGERADIDHVQQQISDERAKVALLRAEVANLEQPERLETLSARYLHLQPIDARHEIDPQSLAVVARAADPQPKTTAGAAASTPTIASPATATTPGDTAAADDPAGQPVEPAPDEAPAAPSPQSAQAR